jgi:hypothetical protein
VESGSEDVLGAVEEDQRGRKLPGLSPPRHGQGGDLEHQACARALGCCRARSRSVAETTTNPRPGTDTEWRREGVVRPHCLRRPSAGRGQCPVAGRAQRLDGGRLPAHGVAAGASGGEEVKVRRGRVVALWRWTGEGEALRCAAVARSRGDGGAPPKDFRLHRDKRRSRKLNYFLINFD